MPSIRYIFLVLLFLIACNSGVPSSTIPESPSPTPIQTEPVNILDGSTATAVFIPTTLPSEISAPLPTATNLPTATPRPPYVEGRMSILLGEALRNPAVDQGKLLLSHLKMVLGETELNPNIRTIDSVSLLIESAQAYVEMNPGTETAVAIEIRLNKLIPPAEQILALHAGEASKGAFLGKVSSQTNPFFTQILEKNAHQLNYQIRSLANYEPSPTLLSVLQQGIEEAQQTLLTQEFAQFQIVNELIVTLNPVIDHEVEDTLAHADIRFVDGQKVCFITILAPGLEDDLDQLKFSLAHERFHCVQEGTFPAQFNGPNHHDNEYLLEQTAQWFATKVYEEIDLSPEIEGFDELSPRKPLYEITYDGLFFPMFLYEESGIQGIYDYFVQSPTSPGQAVQVEFLAQQYAASFESFAQHYLDDNLLGLRFDPHLPNISMHAGHYQFECDKPFKICRKQLHFNGPAHLNVSIEGVGSDMASTPQADIWQPLPFVIDGSCTESEYDYLYFGTTLDEPYVVEIEVKGGTAVVLPESPFKETNIDPNLVGNWEIKASGVTTKTVTGSLGTVNSISYDIGGVICFRQSGEVLSNYQLKYQVHAQGEDGSITQYATVSDSRLSYFSVNQVEQEILMGGFAGPSYQEDSRLATGGFAQMMDPYILNVGTLDRDLFFNEPILQTKFKYHFEDDQLIVTPLTFGQASTYGIYWILSPLEE